MPLWPWILAAVLLGFLLARLKAAQDRLKTLERADPLTGAPNRKAFQEMAEGELERSRRSSRPLTVAHLDVDDFRALNARSGQAAGDELLKTMAETIRGRLRGTDRFARTGGDEFSLLLPETGLSDAREPLEKIRLSLVEAARARGWPVTFSLASRSYVQTPASVDEMLKGTGEVMRTLKSSGKDRSEHA